MASFTATSGGVVISTFQKQIVSPFNGLKAVHFARKMFALPSLRSSRSIFPVLCAAKPDTMNKVCDIVRSQLALPKDSSLTPDSKFSELGADSLDTVEIVMALEEEFKISVEEENSESITTVQEAADLIERLVEKKGGAGEGEKNSKA